MALTARPSRPRPINPWTTWTSTRVSPHAHGGARSVGIIIVDHGSRRGGERRLESPAGLRGDAGAEALGRGGRRTWSSVAGGPSTRCGGGLRHIVCPFRRGGTSGDVGAAGRGGESAQCSAPATPPLGEAPALLDLVHDVVSAGVKDATPDQGDGGFGFFGAIAEMMEAENAASR